MKKYDYKWNKKKVYIFNSLISVCMQCSLKNSISDRICKYSSYGFIYSVPELQLTEVFIICMLKFEKDCHTSLLVQEE